MSFIAIDRRASRIAGEASILTSAAGPRAIFSEDDRSSISGWLTKIAVALICILLPAVLAAAFMTQKINRVEAFLLAAELHPTCSVERDCWIGPQAMAAKGVVDGAISPVPLAVLAPAPLPPEAVKPPIAAPRVAPAASFGLLVPPQSGWSGLDAAPGKGRSAADGSAHRLSVAMQKAFAKPKPTGTPAKMQTTSNRKPALAQRSATL